MMGQLAVSAQGSGKTLTFDGSSEFVDIGDEVANGCRTIEVWFKPAVDITSSLNEPKSLVMRDYNNSSGLNQNEFGLSFYPASWAQGGRLVFLRRIGTTLYEIYSDANFWEADHWYHVCGTIDPSGGMKMYINGVLQQDTDPTTSPIGTQTGTVWDKVSIGRWGNLNIRYFQGEMDEIRLWETVRTQQQVREKMCSSLQGNETGLRAYYKFDSGLGTTLIDHSPNTYDGTLQSMANGNWIYSGAPIGDTSTFIYPGNLSGTSLTLNTGAGDALTVDNINSSAEGVQLYKVNVLPNVTTNLIAPTTGNYYGVFLSSTNGTYNVQYDYSNYNCSSCDDIFTRNDNADLNWQQLTGSIQNCTFSLINESSVGYDYRAEYIISSGSGAVPSGFLGADTTLCAGSSLILDPQQQNSTFLWQDNSTGSTFNVTQPGLYFVEVTGSCGTYSDSIYVDFLTSPSFDLGADTLLCQSTTLLLDPGITNLPLIWQDGSTSTTYNVTQTGVYFVTTTDNCGTYSDTIEVYFGTVPSVDLGPDTTLCPNTSVQYSANTPLAIYQWQDGSTNPDYSVNQAGTYWVSVTNSCGSDSDTVIVQMTQLPSLNLGNDTTLCDGQLLVLDPGITSGTLVWQDGSNSPTYSVGAGGTYSATLTVNGCSVTDNVLIEFVEAPHIDLGEDVLMCAGGQISLNAGSTGSYAWSTGSNESYIIATSAGEYSVTVTNACGNDFDTILVGVKDCYCSYYLPNTITPDNDEFNQDLEFYYDCDIYRFIFRIYNRWGELIYETYDPNDFWDGTYKGRLVPVGTYIYDLVIETTEGIVNKHTGHINVLY